jgi:hypothetical protein
MTTLLRFAVARGLRLDNPAKGIKKPPTRKLDGFLSQALNMDSGFATSSVDAARVEAGIVYLAGNYCRGHARPCIVEML